MALDFCGQNLRGRSFKGRQDLAGANFSYADIRGVNFNGANLTGANFSYAKAGLQPRWVIFLVFVSWLLSGLSGFLWAVDGFLVAQKFNTGLDIVDEMGFWTALIVLIAFFFVTIRQGVVAGLGAFAFTVTFTVAVAVAFDFAGAGAFAGAVAKAGAFAGAVIVAVAFAFAVAVAFAFTVAVAFAFTVAVAFAFTVAVAVAVTVAVAGAVTVAVAGSFPFTVAFAVAGTLFSIYISWRAMKGDQKHSLIRNLAVAFAATGGTSFRGADLTGANFIQATLKSTDLRKAILTNTCWHQARLLDRVRPGSTYLQNSQVRQLLVTGEGQDKKVFTSCQNRSHG